MACVVIIGLLLTGDVVLVCFSFISLASILSFVISMVHFRGWQMGVSQSITIVILVGIIAA